ncbi:uncharacterized protein LOC141696185 [Apium graveolens]|uniref:uncharacterized protein LOC141696185 n=1 Tax=Apium graveolens TaxID=4045 RepID=UPI003D793BC4
MVYVHPASGERFYMRLLLNIVVGVKMFEEIRTVDGIVYSTYKEACFHRGLLESGKEWHIALTDASLCVSASQLHNLFVTLLVFAKLVTPQNSGQATGKIWLTILNTNGLPELNTVSTSKYKNELLLEEMMYDCEKLHLKSSEAVHCLNQMQRIIFDQIVESVDKDIGGFYFVYGPGGTGKTFLWSTIIARLRGEGKIVLAVVSSGIASLLIDGGRTAHSRFKIPIDADEFSCCEVKQNTFLAELIYSTSLVIWDEAPMTHRFVFEAVDHTFRDIRSKVDPNVGTLPYDGLTMVLGGDFRPVLPVIQKKGREEIVATSISKSRLWQYCKVFTLRENMRIERNVPKVTIRGKKVQFRDWVLSLGDGLEQTIIIGDDPEPSWITLPEEASTKNWNRPLCFCWSALEIHPIFSVLSIGIYVSMDHFILPGEFKVYKSYDSICKGSSTSEADEVLYPPEYLNSLKSSGMPNHEIAVKVGAPIMLLRNLNAKKGLCNGTRLIITRCYPFLIEALIITGTRIGDTTYVPRITMCPADKTVLFVLKRKQFPIAVCYAMTVNKSQGQTIQNVGLYLPDPIFGHGQMYVAVSRVPSPNGLKIVTVDDNEVTKGYTKNIVYREVFDNLVQSLATAYANDGLVSEAERNISTVENLIEPITELPKFALGSTIAPIK